MGLIDAARAKADARPVRRRFGITLRSAQRTACYSTRTLPPTPLVFDYDRMKRVYPKQKAALTRAIKTKDPEKIAAVCKAAVAEWNAIGAWPDNWNRWQVALDDALPWGRAVSIEDL